jgi:hypothetical protein
MFMDRYEWTQASTVSQGCIPSSAKNKVVVKQGAAKAYAQMNPKD